MLCGILATASNPEGVKRGKTLRMERMFLGSVLGSLEGWLGVRSLRTMELRVQRQSSSATNLVSWLDAALKGEATGKEADIIKKVVSKVLHASLQKEDMEWLKPQMPNGFGPVFSIYTHTQEQARNLPSLLRLFHHATSLGGVESLIEWRRMSDSDVDERLLRVSVGVESWEDLKGDFLRGFELLAEGSKEEEKKDNVQVDVQTGGEGAKGVAAADGAV